MFSGSLRAGLIIFAALCLTTDAAVVFSHSFEAPFQRNWTLVEGTVGEVVTSDPIMAGSNFDGVDGQYFLMFGWGSNPGHIYFTIATVPGQQYSVSYNFAGTDSWSQPRRDQSVTLASTVKAYEGIILVPSPHTGELVPKENWVTLGQEEHQITNPGLQSWAIHSWDTAEYTFTASTNSVRLYFDTAAVSAYTTVGALDQITVQTVPEPSTLTYLAGTAFFGLMRRRARRK